LFATNDIFSYLPGIIVENHYLPTNLMQLNTGKTVSLRIYIFIIVHTHGAKKRRVLLRPEVIYECTGKRPETISGQEGTNEESFLLRL